MIENVEIKKTYEMLMSKKEKIWRRVADLLVIPKRRRISVNLNKINRFVKQGDTVVIPGKVLGHGLNKKINICAMSYSQTAKANIEKAGSKIMSFDELIKQNPKGTNVKILR